MSKKNSLPLSPYVVSHEFSMQLRYNSKEADQLQRLLKPEEDLSSLPNELRQRHCVIEAHSSLLFQALAYDRLGGKKSGNCTIKNHEDELNYAARVLSHLSIARSILKAYEQYTMPYNIATKVTAEFDPDNHFHKRLTSPSSAGLTMNLINSLRDTKECLRTSYSA